jgi:hypothetical protein
MNTDLGAPRSDFAASHALIPVILGATAFLDDLARCVDERSAAEPPGPAPDALLLDALLGLLALRRALRLWTAAAAAEGYASERTPATSHASEGRYLR